MDSQVQPQLPALSAPVPEPGSVPLRRDTHERYAIARAAMFGRLEAAREAGYPHMTAGNAAKLDRLPSVAARIAYLSRDTVRAVTQLRSKVANKLNVIRDVSMFDFVRMERDPGQVRYLRDKISPASIEKMRKTLEAMGKTEPEIAAAIAALPTPQEIEEMIAALPVLPYLDLTKIAALDPDEQREIMSAVKSVSHTEHGPKFEIHSPLEAIAQLRKMSGLDEAEKHDVTGALTLEALVGASYAKPKQVEPDEVIKQEAAE
jgi:hypothetical protein